MYNLGHFTSNATIPILAQDQNKPVSINIPKAFFHSTGLTLDISTSCLEYFTEKH